MYATLEIEHRTYIMPLKDAAVILEMVGAAEHYQEKWRKQDEGGTTYHVWKQHEGEVPETRHLTLVPDELYRMAKLAGPVIDK